MLAHLTPTEYVQLFGAAQPPQDAATRLHDDMYVSLIALINLYGGVSRTPEQTLSWPADTVARWQRGAREYDAARVRYLDAQVTGDWPATQAALGALLRELMVFADGVKRGARGVRHYHLMGFATWLLARLEPLCATPDAPDAELLLTHCRNARHRFASLLVKHGVHFDPPRVAETFEYRSKTKCPSN